MTRVVGVDPRGGGHPLGTAQGRRLDDLIQAAGAAHPDWRIHLVHMATRQWRDLDDDTEAAA